jgi:hypothetical protein
MIDESKRNYDVLINDLAQLRKLQDYIKNRNHGQSHSFQLENEWKMMKMKASSMEQKILKGATAKEKNTINKLIKERKLI